MYCVLITGAPASGKTTVAEIISQKLSLPMISKDHFKEILFDTIGFQSREEKVALGIAAMKQMYYAAEQLMKVKQSFIMENNFETSSKPELCALLSKYGYTPILIHMTGDDFALYQRFIARDQSAERHLGHVVNDCYPPKEGFRRGSSPLKFEDYVKMIESRGMKDFTLEGPQITMDTTTDQPLDLEKLIDQLRQKLIEQ